MAPKNEAKRPRSGSDDQDLALEELIQNYQKIEKPEVKDLSDFFIQYLKTSNNLNTRFNDCEDRVSELEKRCDLKDTHIKNIEEHLHEVEDNQTTLKTELEEKINNLSDQLEVAKQQIELNSTQTLYMQQLYMDKDLILKGFPTKPDPETVVKNFIKHYDLNIGHVREYYYVDYSKNTKQNSASSKNRSLHFVVISFKSKSAKVEAFKKKKEKGLPLLKNLLPDATENRDAIIKCSNKLTKFNLHVQHILYKAQEKKIIFEYRYHNYLFQCKQEENSEWFRIDSYKKIKIISQEVYKI